MSDLGNTNREDRQLVLGKHCPLCGYLGFRLFQAHGCWIRECQTCSHRWAEIGVPEGHVENVYGDSYFEDGGAGYPGYTKLGPLLLAHGRRYAQILTRYSKPGTVLDVGSAAGFILRGLQDSGWTGEGIEPNPTMASYAVNELGLRVTQTTFEEFRTEKRFDLITMVQVLPHVVDPLAVLDKARRLTTPRGILLIETWNCRSWTAKMFGKRWHEYSPPSVLHWFSPSTLRSLVEGSGYTNVASGRPLKYITGAHIRSIIRHVTQSSMLRPMRAVARFIPSNSKVRYPAEDLFWTVFRKTSTG